MHNRDSGNCERRNCFFVIRGMSTLALSLAIMGVGMLGGEAHATEATLTITLSSANISANVAPVADATGTFTQSSPITVGVSTDNATGYTLGIKANDNTYPDRLINATDSSYLSSISTATNLATFKATDLSSITTSGGNQGIWGYLPSKLNSVANTDFLPSPGTAGNTIDETASANSTAINYTIALGAKVSPLATLGAYTNAFTITAVANPIPYTIIYAENTVTGMPDNVLDGSSASTSVTISSITPTRDGYRFLGWCDQATTKSGNSDTCATGHSHQPGGTISLNQTGANNIKLYAIWTEPMTFNEAFAAAGKSQSSGYYVMQDATSGICSAVDTGEIGEVKDSRDGTVYHIGKLADGNCWLLDNLAIDLTNPTVLNGMNENNTHASNTTLGYLKNGGGTTSDKYATAAVANWTSSESYSAPLVNMSNKDVVPTSYDGTDDPMKDKVVAGNWKVGGYYNYCATSAGSYCYGDGTSGGTSSGDATEDICPAGWRMPTGSTSGEYSALAQAIYGSTGSTSDATAYANYRSALRLPLSGFFYDGSAYSQGSGGCWWSSTRYGNTYMYRLSADTSYIYPAIRNGRHDGFSVRCVLGS